MKERAEDMTLFVERTAVVPAFIRDIVRPFLSSMQGSFQHRSHGDPEHGPYERGKVLSTHSKLSEDPVVDL